MWFLLIYLLIAGVQAQTERIRTVLRGTESPCKGRLEVYYKGEWGSVCYHQWNGPANGEVVCRSLGCGKYVHSSYHTDLPIINVRDFPPPSTMWMDEVECDGTEKSIWDCKARKSNITQCNRDDHFIVVECSERIRTVLRGTESPCKGRLEVYYKGEWGSVCQHQWNGPANGEVVCRSLGCGKYVHSSYHTDLPIVNVRDFPPPSTMWMDEVECNGTEKSIWDCKARKSNITQCNRDDHFIVVECSGSINLSLNGIGHLDECAGVVQFETQDHTVSLCNDNWNEITADMVCEEKECGKHHKIPKAGTFQGKPRDYGLPLSCIGNERFSWQCVDWVTTKSNNCQTEASVICSNHKRIRLSEGEDVCSGVLQNNTNGVWTPVQFTPEIKTMADDICSGLRCGKSTYINESSNPDKTFLKCTDRVTVELSNKCFGELYVSVNDSRQLVCIDDLTETEQKQMGTVVCKQLGCGKLLKISAEVKNSKGDRLGQVDCTGEEDSLWDCLAKQQPAGVCSSSKVVCAVLEEVQLQDGHSRCSGRLEVKLEGLWRRVRSSDWNGINSDVVCKQLGCGETQRFHNNIFIESRSSFLKWKLKCDKDSKNLSQCLGDQWELAPNTDERSLKSVNIVCKEKFYNLQGDHPCEGTAVEVSGGKAVNLTLEQDKWNETANDICKQMRCGSVFSLNPSNPQPLENPLCSNSASDLTSNSTSNSTSDLTSIPTCTTIKKTPQKTDRTPAYINCTDSVTVELSEKCWGMVKVCRGSRCEGVCRDIWKEQQSKMLCENLNCGTVISGQFGGPTVEESVTIGSIHCPDQTTKISQCMFFNLTHSSCSNPAYVACTGSVKANLADPRKKCAGKAQLFYLGMWRPVCSDASSAIQNTICNNMGCGNVLSFTQSGNKEQGVSTINCENNDITSCTGTVSQSCSVAYLECEDWRRLLIATDHACSGRVYAESRHPNLQFVSREGWNQTEGEKLCKYLQCNKYSNYTDHTLQENHTYSLWKKSYSCKSSSKDIWECEDKKEPTMHQQLDINCDGEPDIRLEGNCTGQVIINQNDRVCWKPQNTERVFTELCQQLKCSSFLTSWENKNKTIQNGHSFKCSGKEKNLWQCSSSKEKCGSVLSLACAGAVEFQFTEKCGGELKVKYRGEWETVGFKSRDDVSVICEHMQCGRGRYLTDSDLRTKILFECENKESHPKHCIKISSGNYRTTFTCEKHVPPVVVPAPNTALIVGLVIGLLFLLLAIIIGIWKRKTVLAMLRLRPAGKDQDVELSSNEMQDLNERNETDLQERKSSMFEMDDYEDADLIMSQEDEESKNQEPHPDEEEGGSGSGGSSMTEYDDVEERNEKPIRSENSSPTEPLLPPRPANILDDVRYEVELEELEEMEEDYDDAAPAVSAEQGDTSGGKDEQNRQKDE